MKDFTYYAPTKIFFGVGEEKKVGSIISSYGYKKIMLHYGGGSIKKTGLYDRVVRSLEAAGIEYVDFGGAEPNPKLSHVRKGAGICRDEGIELVLAVGGGSAIDSAKAISVQAANDEDMWLYAMKKATPKKALKTATILTLSASGSEMSSSCVITNDEREAWLKRGFGSELNRPLFSILNPELTYTLPPYQTACGIVDIMMHTLERYLTKAGESALTDRIAESLLKTVVEAGAKAIECPEDYEARAQLMWAGSLSHNDLTACGRDYFMVSHQIEHELSGMYDYVAHGAGLAVVFPAWCKYAYKYNIPRFCRFAKSVWGIEVDLFDMEKTALRGIEATESFFRSIGMPTRIGELNIPASAYDEMAEKCTNYGERTLPGYIDYGKKEIIEILKLAE
ncbi:MAG: iron-containing alcohol dehydrogenase [Clostridiales bacterium]|nr:iron-containing alcohol dehydrogenase [Clostridiales bacterium]